MLHIHGMQATFGSERKQGSEEYEYMEEALSKRHSMAHEAVESGQKANAYRTILTHFSQRYPKIPAVDDSFRASTCIAFDLMSVNLQGEKCTPSFWGKAVGVILQWQSSCTPNMCICVRATI